MSGQFKSGQLVSIVEWTDAVELYNVPGGNKQDYSEPKVIGKMLRADAALVLYVTKLGGDVYVHGPHGSGWTFGAFLTVMPET